jgi:hypothetical protein
MKKLLGIVFLGLLLSGNAYAKVGKGELKLSKSTMNHLMQYLYGAGNSKYSGDAEKKNQPLLMAISEDGNSSYYYYCPYVHCEIQSDEIFKVIKFCEKLSNGSPCYLFAKKRRIKWKNSINTKSTHIKKKLLKEPYQVAKIIQDLGFYDNDISELPGIDYETGQLDEEKTVTGKMDNYDYPSLIASLTASHKSDWKKYVKIKDPHKVWFMAKRKNKYMSYSWQTGTATMSYTEGKGFDGCNDYLKQKPKDYPKDTLCVLYYKGTTPTTDQEKIETAKKYYSQVEVERFFEKYPYVLNDSTNSLLKKSKITKKITQSDDDIVSKLKDLKELLDSGVLTKEEFEKAKKKLLN